MSHLPEEDTRSRIEQYASVRGESTIWAYMKSGRQSCERLEDTLEKLIYALAKEKKTYFDMCIDLRNHAMPDPLFRSEVQKSTLPEWWKS